MKLADKLVLGAAMVGQLACSALQSGERRDFDQAGVSALRRAPERDLKEEPVSPEVLQNAAKLAEAVEKCVNGRGGRVALEVSDNEAYIAESVKPSGVRPEVGIRVGQYFMCNEKNDSCGVRYAIPNGFGDNFGLQFERFGLETWRFHDASSYNGKMTGADGQADRAFDFVLPPNQYGGHDAVCVQMRAGDSDEAFIDYRPANNAIRPHTDIIGCRQPSTPNMTRAHFQDVYRVILAKLADACAAGKVHVPGEQYVRPKWSGHGLGTIDGGSGTGRR